MIVGRGSAQVALRLPQNLRDRIKWAAQAAGRSMNTEIAMALERAFPALTAAGEGLQASAPAAVNDHSALQGG